MAETQEVVLARLETAFNAHSLHDAAVFQQFRADHKELRSLVEELHRKFDKQKSFIGGVVLAASAIVAAIWATFTFFYHR
jgi:hypothetical protein